MHQSKLHPSCSLDLTPFDKVLNIWEGLGPGKAGHRVIIRKTDAGTPHLLLPYEDDPKLEHQFPKPSLKLMPG